MKKWKILACVAFALLFVFEIAESVYLNNKIRRVARYEKSTFDQILQKSNLNEKEALGNIENELIHLQISLALLDRKQDMKRFYVSDGYLDDAAYIAHGGGVGKFTYTNSKEAMIDSLSRKFKFIEIDMIETRDHHIVGGHDWNHFGQITRGENSGGGIVC